MKKSEKKQLSNIEAQIERWCREITKRDGEFDRELAMAFAEVRLREMGELSKPAAYEALEYGARRAREYARV